MNRNACNSLWTREVAKAPKYISLPSFLFVLFYPLVAPLANRARDNWREKKRYAIITCFIVLGSLGLCVFSTGKVIEHLGFPMWDIRGLQVPEAILAILSFLAGYFLLWIVITLFVNLLVYTMLLAMEYPLLMRREFSEAGRRSIWQWEKRLLGHKVWSGRNTYALLQYLMNDAAGQTGRAKWFLVNFLQEELEHIIEPRGNPVLYDITVDGWTIARYSRFLAENMAHAEDSIEWVVDPRDLFREILPELIAEVLISIGVKIDNTLADAVSRLSTDGPHSLRSLLGAWAIHCPKYSSGMCGNGGKCNEVNRSCSGFAFSSATRLGELDHVRSAAFKASVQLLAEAANVGNLKTVRQKKKAMLCVGEKKISFADIRSLYDERETKKLAPRLPHIREFRSASCRKRRFVYLGTRTTGENTDDLIAKAIQGAFAGVKDVHYCESLGPDTKSTNDHDGLLRRWLYAEQDNPDGPLKLRDGPLAEQWGDLEEDVRSLIIEWGLRLFEHTSGGPQVVKGAFSTDTPPQAKYPGYSDIGIYDSSLVISSAPGADDSRRAVTWQVYDGPAPIKSYYFPTDDQEDLLVSWDMLCNHIISILAK